ncbi:MAG: twin-arginine translocation signal domain-containing protein, partial [Eggerthella lenta]
MQEQARILDQGISRRGFLTGAAMVGAGAALGLAGCSGSSDAETKTPAEEVASAPD